MYSVTRLLQVIKPRQEKSHICPRKVSVQIVITINIKQNFSLKIDEHEWSELPKEKKDNLIDRLERGLEKRGVYTADIEGAIIVSSPTVFPRIGAIDPERKGSLLGDCKQIHWTEWINSQILYSLEPKYPNIDSSAFLVSLDVDATIIHTNTLKVLNQAFNVHVSPKFNSWATKIKHVYKGITLHNVVNIELGYG